MNNVTLTRFEATLFVATLLVPLLIEAALAVTAFPRLQWLMPTSMLFPAGLLAGIGLRGGRGAEAPAAPPRDLRASAGTP